MEIELKLLVTPQGATALRQHPLLGEYAQAAPVELQLRGTYFDTPTLDLRRHEAGLRVRGNGHEWVQTLKGGGSLTGGLHSRHEWESPVVGPSPDLRVLRKLVDRQSEWAKLLRRPGLRGALTPIFTTHVTRTVWNLRLPRGDQVECVLDQGEVQREERRAQISEIELELKSGNAAHLFDFALELLQDIPMRIGNLSKADRGYALVTPQMPVAVKAVSLRLTPGMTVEAAFQAIASNCMAQITANEIGVAEAHDVESLHQMRVGLRRLRSAFTLFRTVLQSPLELQQEIDWLGRQLGAPRDWDVLAGSTLPAVTQTQPHENRIATVMLAALGRAHELHEAAATAVASPRYTRLVLELTCWVQSCGWRETMSSKAKKRLGVALKGFATVTLRHARRRLQKRGAGLAGASAAARHRVRIAAKKVRYATEFFACLYPAETRRPYLKALSLLQDRLGHINDAAVADRLLKQLQEAQVEYASGVDYVRGYLAAQTGHEARRIEKQWTKFATVKAPW
ncbi:MAG: inorganic triphosphatase [Burkholderiaceae bacterium]